MKCKCNKNCIQTKDKTLSKISTLYKACPKCPTKTFKKSIPLKKQIKLEKIDKQYNKCEKCGKRHIDNVIAHVLKILIENNQISQSASLRKIGTPLITPAISLEHLPYLSTKSLVIITNNCDKNTANKIIEQVPEIKAIIHGDTNITAGQKTENEEINNYTLLSGCDIRCDIQYTDIEPILIYKEQSKIHIEYPKAESPKIKQLNEVLKKYKNPTVIDAMCGPGTLGIYSIKKNASKVLFNDIYSKSLDSLKINLEINEIPKESYEIYNENIIDLVNNIDKKFNIGIVDTFPNIETTKYVESLEKICDEVVII